MYNISTKLQFKSKYMSTLEFVYTLIQQFNDDIPKYMSSSSVVTTTSKTNASQERNMITPLSTRTVTVQLK